MSWSWWSQQDPKSAETQSSQSIPSSAQTSNPSTAHTTTRTSSVQPTHPAPSTIPSTSSTAESTPDTSAPIPPRGNKSREAQAYEELIDLFTSIDPEKTAAAAATAREIASRPPEETRESMFADTMSCSQCFDMAYYCSSVGGQLNNVYRYGALRSCSDLWAQWRFCMRSKAWGDETRRIKTREFNREKAAKFKIGKSSEDIWEVRKEPVENAFQAARTEVEA